jgi:hypothetical protein
LKALELSGCSPVVAKRIDHLQPILGTDTDFVAAAAEALGSGSGLIDCAETRHDERGGTKSIERELGHDALRFWFEEF